MAVSKAPKKSPPAIDYSATRQTFQKSEAFERYLAGYPDASGLLAYVYRLKPKIDLSLIGIRDSYIMKIANPGQMNRAWLASEKGRGHYMLTLTDANREKGQQQLCKTWFEIDDPEVGPPVYDPRTLLLAEPENSDEINRQVNAGVFVRDAMGSPVLKGNGAPSVPPPNPNPPQNGAAVNSQITDNVTGLLLGKLIDRAIPALAPQAPQSFAEQLTQAFEIADRLKVAAPSLPLPTVDEIAAKLEERLKAANPPAAPVDPVKAAMESIETAQKFQELMEKISGKNGTGAGRSHWYDKLPDIFEGAKQLIPEVVRGVQNVRSMYRGAGENGQLPVNGVSRPSEGPGAHFGGNGTVDAPLVETALPDGLGELLKFGLDQFLAGVSGFATAVFLVGARPGGLEVFRKVESLGADSCLSLLGMVAAGRAILGNPAQKAAVKVWLEDFISFDPDEETQEPKATDAGEAVAGAAE